MLTAQRITVARIGFDSVSSLRVGSKKNKRVGIVEVRPVEADMCVRHGARQASFHALTCYNAVILTLTHDVFELSLTQTLSVLLH